MSSKKLTFKHGVHPNDNKDLTKDIAISEMPLLSDYYVSLNQHIGAPAEAIVAKGDVVKEGQLIAKATSKVSANIFSPVAGNVVAIEKHKNAMDVMCNYIHIKREGDEKVSLEPLTEITSDSIKKRIAEAGIIGLGGAGFPTEVKLSPMKPVDTLVINAAECEPYLTCDDRMMLEHANEVAEGIRLLAKAINVPNIVVGIEDNKMEAYEKMKATGLNVALLKKQYPQGAEKMLIFACTGRKVPNKGALPMDAGVVVQNIATAYAVYDAVVNGTPLYKRVLTVSGQGVDSPSNLWVLNGTPHSEILAHCGVNENVEKLISGGPMMGHALYSDNCFTTKTESGILALAVQEINTLNPTNCINCGACAKACPMNLMPMYIDFYAQSGKFDIANKYGAMDCMECGCCAFTCPAKRALVQSIRLAKKALREARK